MEKGNGTPSLLGTHREILFDGYYFYKPSSKLSGDFFDFIEIDENRIGVLICDVMGHGIASSLIASSFKVLINELAKEKDKPNEITAEFDCLIVFFHKKG